MKILRFISMLSVGILGCSWLLSPSEALAHKGIDFVAVYNTNDDGAGSLRNAMLHANDDENTQIVFQIPITDKGYNSKTGIFTVEPRTPLPVVTTKGTIFDGLAQTLINDSNKTGPEVRISGKKIAREPGAPPATGIVLSAPECQMKGVILSDFSGVALALRGERTIECRVQSNVFEGNKGANLVLQSGASGNWIGIAPDASPFDEEFDGIYAKDMGNDFYTDKADAVRISGELTRSNSIRGNRFYGTGQTIVGGKLTTPALAISREEEGVNHQITVVFSGKPNQKYTLDLMRYQDEMPVIGPSQTTLQTHEVETDKEGALTWKTMWKGYPVGSWVAQITSREGESGGFSNVVVKPYLN